MVGEPLLYGCRQRPREPQSAPARLSGVRGRRHETNPYHDVKKPHLPEPSNARAAPAARSLSAPALGLPTHPAAARRRRGGAGCFPLAGARRRAGFFAGGFSAFAPARSTSSTTESAAASPWRAPSLTTRV